MIPILFEDQWLMVVDKPSGLLVIPTPKGERRTLTNLLNQGLKEQGIAYRLHPCHRLDRDTSGLVIYAKGKATQQRMMEEFRQRRIRKTYLAFVQGVVARGHGEIDSPLEGRRAVTRYTVLEKRKGFSVVEVSPLTGRKNQIRMHFKKMGNPVLGDTRFVFRRHFKIKARRLCLHAKGIEFTHPVTHRRVCVDSALPVKLQEFLDERRG